MTPFDLPRALRELGITDAMIRNCRSPRFEDAAGLVDAGRDMFDRPQKMTRATFGAWRRLRDRARQSGMDIQLVSAFRSAEYQCELIRSKLRQGRGIEDILRANAIPGYSEHHTGRALDLHAGDGEPLSADFENQPAFGWLCDNAAAFGFVLSYPRGNEQGMEYEPWHWCHRGA